MGMKHTALLFVAVAVLLALPNLDIQAESQQTLIGEYEWNQGPTGEIKAVFTETGNGTWKVDFYFDFRDKPHTYSGTAEGDLSQGKLEGTVKNEDKRRTFTFSGSFEDGTFHGSHAETTRGRAGDTGTITLSAAS